MKTILLLFFLSLEIFAFAQDSLSTDFKKYNIKISEYECALDSSFVSYNTSCEKFQLIWIEYINNSGTDIVRIKENSFSFRVLNQENYCSDLKEIEKLNKKNSRKKNTYGLWFFSQKPIGDRYVIITAEQAISSVNQEIYYYERVK
ncbi:MAG: hypothetical protein ACPG45_08100 [Flavobacteriaceae bacterium]